MDLDVLFATGLSEADKEGSRVEGYIYGMACDGFLNGLLTQKSSTISSTTSSTDLGGDIPCLFYNAKAKKVEAMNRSDALL